MTTKISAVTTWNEICKLSTVLANVGCDGVREDFVYMANHSMGDREWDASQSNQFIEDGDDGDGWLGFSEEGSTRFLWGSARSHATIEAKRGSDGGWSLRFGGSTADELKRRGYESSYIIIFARTIVDLTTLMVERVADGLGVQLSEWVQSTHDRVDDHRPDDKVIDHVRQFAATIAKYVDIDARLDEDELLEFEYGDSWR